MTEVSEAARRAIHRHAWSEAFEILSAHDKSEELEPVALEMLGEVAWWTSHIDVCIDARERAYAGYLSRGDVPRAGLICVSLAEDHFHRLEESIANGWLHRAESILADHPDTVEYGWLARLQSVVAYEGRGDITGSLEHARSAHEIAARFQDHDLQALTLHDQGRFTLAGGQVEEGLCLMEEAMVRAVSEELDARVTGRIYCNMIDACDQMADYRRAYEWDEAARRWCDRVGHDSGFPGICRIKRADILHHRGEWVEAEAEARRACEELGDFLDFAGKGFASIGDVRLRVGDLAGAEEAFRRARELGHDAEPGLALLCLAKGESDAALQLITQALDDVRPPLHRAHLLPARIEIALVSGNSEAAQEGVTELQNIAGELQSDAFSAAAADGIGLLALYQGKIPEAVESLNRAAKLWKSCGLPYEAARSRLNLAAAYRELGDEELTRIEAEAARSVFNRLGAEPAVREASKLLEAEGAAKSADEPVGGPGPSSERRTATQFDVLTPRELEILEMIAQGHSNAEIAGQLSVSPHTVRNHINRVFSKLEVRDRAQAIVIAHRAGIGTNA